MGVNGNGTHRLPGESPAVRRLADLLGEVTEADLAELDAEIARLARTRAAVAAALGKAVAPAPSGCPGRGDRLGRRATCAPRIADALSAGPLPVAELARRTGIAPHNVSGVLARHPAWFEKAGPGRRDPYRLTGAGRAALLPPGTA